MFATGALSQDPDLPDPTAENGQEAAGMCRDHTFIMKTLVKFNGTFGIHVMLTQTMIFFMGAMLTRPKTDETSGR